MVVRNDLDRFHLVSDVIDRVPKLGYLAAYAKQEMRDKLIEHKQYITRYGDDMPEVKQWRLAGGGRRIEFNIGQSTRTQCWRFHSKLLPTS